MSNKRKTSYINAACPLALTVSASINGGFTYSVIDYSKTERVLQQSLPTELEAFAAGWDAAEGYAVAFIKEQFAAARRGDRETLED